MTYVYSLQEHCKAKFLFTVITGYYCITIMDLCDTIITLSISLHITNTIQVRHIPEVVCMTRQLHAAAITVDEHTKREYLE